MRSRVAPWRASAPLRATGGPSIPALGRARGGTGTGVAAQRWMSGVLAGGEGWRFLVPAPPAVGRRMLPGRQGGPESGGAKDPRADRAVPSDDDEPSSVTCVPRSRCYPSRCFLPARANHLRPGDEEQGEATRKPPRPVGRIDRQRVELPVHRPLARRPVARSNGGRDRARPASLPPAPGVPAAEGVPEQGGRRGSAAGSGSPSAVRRRAPWTRRSRRGTIGAPVRMAINAEPEAERGRADRAGRGEYRLRP